MKGLLAQCKKEFGTLNLYEVLSLEKSASSSEVKRAYYKLSLKVHPDRVAATEQRSATVVFQILGKVYAVLSDKEKRAVYDETGEVDDDNDIFKQERDWMDYWRLVYQKVSTKDIEDFEEKYKGSEEELEDLKTAYVDYEGDMESILANVLCCTGEDETRFRKLLKKCIQKKELPEFEKFVNEDKQAEKARKRKAKREAAEAEELAKKLGLRGGGSEADLSALILQKQQSRAAGAEDFFSALEAKYAQPKKKGDKRKRKP
ncbi:PREDICTED: dnaJ homolog subfamily C member 9-like [Priapulus caudatus]|uniref:DnaJ homolog subfamily C member 9-like n=1 Tax=Priapulus caudatus TaxID=37621 RepID=A0ABM1EU81_PRICU|nr:PREDICTED: dnaJ homolog subfamily C member 9-like [Priapulus caudatus]